MKNKKNENNQRKISERQEYSNKNRKSETRKHHEIRSGELY